MNAHPTTSSASLSRVTYGALYDLCDADRQQAEGLQRIYDEDLRAAKTDLDRIFYRRRRSECSTRAAQFLALQKLIGRIDASAVIKGELKAIAERERAAGDREGSTHEG